MDPTLGREADAVAFLTALSRAPYRFDFYQTLRRLECLYADKPRWGRALRPLDEPIRLGQDADLSFAPAPLASFETSSRGIPTGTGRVTIASPDTLARSSRWRVRQFTIEMPCPTWRGCSTSAR
jgi:predicted component of type VI protein secretion system